jgi:hypothetical protein
MRGYLSLSFDVGTLAPSLVHPFVTTTLRTQVYIGMGIYTIIYLFHSTVTKWEILKVLIFLIQHVFNAKLVN